jgi:uncharacterized protein YutE (UPF0331/DUF86 family)
MHIERLQHLDSNIAELEKLASTMSIDDFKNNITNQWALRYGLFESIQIVIDIACHIVSQNNFGNTNTYRDCIESLEKFDVIGNELGSNLKKMVGLRNILVHDYVEIEITQLYHYVSDLSDFSSFSKAIRNYLR